MAAQLVEYSQEWLEKITEYKTEFESAGQDLEGLEGITTISMPEDSTSTFLYVTENKDILGLLNIRNGLTEEQLQIYGNIGFSIRPGKQHKGLAVQMLEDAGFLCMLLGVSPLRMTCLANNIASRKTIEKIGGEYVGEHILDGVKIVEYRG